MWKKENGKILIQKARKTKITVTMQTSNFLGHDMSY